MKFNKTLIIPCKEEGENFLTILKRFEENIKNDTEIIIVLDSVQDSTFKFIENSETKAKMIINPKDGVASAINFGIESSEEEKVSRLVWNLINKGDCFLKLIDHPKILPLIQHLIGKRVCLCSMGAHMNGSGNEKMALHQDQWPLVPHPMEFPFMANVMYLISDNSPENGGTRLIPGSHKWPLIDYKTANEEEIQKMAVSLTAPKGTAIVWEGRLWHGNGLNRSGSIRSNISTAFLQPWVKPQENHQYSIREEVLKKVTEKQKHILGFSSFGTLGGHDGSSVSPAEFDPNKESIGILKP